MQIIYYSDTLAHHGVKGQKWGVRRYQPYPDGSKKGKFIGKKKKERPMSEDAKTARELRKRNVDELSNAELRKLNERTQLERNYKQLNPNVVKKGVAIAGTVAAAMGTVISIYKNGGKIIKVGKKSVKKMKTK